jgi:hypothetical protein
LAGTISAAVSSTNAKNQANNLYRNDLSMLRLVNHKISKVVIIPECDSGFVKKLLTFYPKD